MFRPTSGPSSSERTSGRSRLIPSHRTSRIVNRGRSKTRRTPRLAAKSPSAIKKAGRTMRRATPSLSLEPLPAPRRLPRETGEPIHDRPGPRRDRDLLSRSLSISSPNAWALAETTCSRHREHEIALFRIRSTSSSNPIPVPRAISGSRLVSVIPGRVLTSKT